MFVAKTSSFWKWHSTFHTINSFFLNRNFSDSFLKMVKMNFFQSCLAEDADLKSFLTRKRYEKMRSYLQVLTASACSKKKFFFCFMGLRAFPFFFFFLQFFSANVVYNIGVSKKQFPRNLCIFTTWNKIRNISEKSLACIRYFFLSRFQLLFLSNAYFLTNTSHRIRRQ